jgi:hypothetical protein
MVNRNDAIHRITQQCHDRARLWKMGLNALAIVAPDRAQLRNFGQLQAAQRPFDCGMRPRSHARRIRFRHVDLKKVFRRKISREDIGQRHAAGLGEMQEQQELIAGCRCRAHDDVGAMAIASCSFAQQVLQPHLFVALPQDFVAFANGDIALAQDLVPLPERFVALAQDLVPLPERFVALAQIGIAFGEYLIALAQDFFVLSGHGGGCDFLEFEPLHSARAKAGKAFKQAHEAPKLTDRRQPQHIANRHTYHHRPRIRRYSLHCHELIRATELVKELSHKRTRIWRYRIAFIVLLHGLVAVLRR